MKKVLSIILSICVLFAGLPIMSLALASTPEISFEKFSAQLQEIQAEYDDYYFSEITIENDSEFYYVDGEENILTDTTDDVVEAVVSSDDFEFPFSAIADYCELPETSIYSLNDENCEDITINKETAEALGFEVDIEDDKAVLTQPYQTERLIVKSKYDINPLDSVAIVEGYNDLHIVQFDNQESAKQAEEYYNNQKLIEYAEPDLVMSTMDIDYTVEASAVTSSSITYDNHLSWGSESIGVDDYIDYLGEISELPEIVVGIIDTGVDIDHEFLKDRIIETGFNLSDSGTANSEDDDNGHGSHVAGIVTDNTTDNVKIKAFKCLDENGSGNLSDVVLAIDAAVQNGVDVINMSLGSKGSSSSMEKAINNAVSKGITVCVSAGNSSADASKYTPACVDSCITVAAISLYNQKPYWSNWGSKVDLVAPGVEIYSTYKNNTYDTLSGTSMASPFVAAASAMILSKDCNYNANEVCSVLEDNGRIWYKESASQYIDGLYGKKAVYIGTVTDFNKDRTLMPKFSFESGKYSDNIALEITCEDENAEIYYTLDGSRASQDTGILYTEPVIIDKVTSVHAVAYAPDKLKSLQIVAEYYITYTDDEGKFEIDSDGLITAYNGTNNYLTIPDTIAGITVTGIGAYVFNRSDIIMIKFPDSLTYVGDHAFYFARYLYSVIANNIQYIGPYGFSRCTKLAEIDLTNAEIIETYGCHDLKALNSFYNDKLTTIEECAFYQCNYLINIDIPNVKKIENGAFRNCYRLEELNAPNVESIGASAFYYCSHIETIDLPQLTSMGNNSFYLTKSLKNLNIPNCYGDIPKSAFRSSGIENINLKGITSVGDTAFYNSKIKTIILNNAVSIGEEAFSKCNYLETVYIPNAVEIKSQTFNETTNVKIIFAPSLETTPSLPNCDDVTIYLSDSSTQLPATSGNYTYNIIAPSGSYAEQWAKDNGHTFLPSESCYYSGVEDENFVYTCENNGETATLPVDIVGSMWNDVIINKQTDYDTYTFLLDFTNDKCINAKDFAVLNKDFKV